ncbi:2-dehydro-3-deoxyphosphogluconate aldolase / (4S)-4-hydroxy-2-oxoglutarate aldolase [Allopseudospirillum japonicum]|uniref:2-dehydro-3-deoxyphosphogluconate aldolase / (4S)-4-hydroxy-2-oxoglutarate aldolase n=1 Tax=Allopseudospirillum japonicum TaxID=64971 RepID=A0A1H6S065_9GAMM|nr:hypothetical protein [Allopseudospirillum japonicum]SEI61413.1 2-dehydro-3-deoxyphosphogluconate aldolase / (4S)-4-hydroxy-2-oxoglutarate aldolase [Allopseudospirillum japonicum]
MSLAFWQALGPVFPVVTTLPKLIPSWQALGEHLSMQGAKVCELTLRDANAWENIRAWQEAVPELPLVVGSVTQQSQVKALKQMGVQAIVTPGWMPALVEEALNLKMHILPGIATAGELMQAQAYGLSAVKIFPIEPLGGIGYLSALHAALPQMYFCPTGGINASKAAAYLQLPYVFAVGGSWLVASH